jgi:hypothetical protein
MYVRNFNEFKSINEGLFGNLFKSLKSKVAMSISKNLGGSAKKVDSLLDRYEQDLKQLMKDKNDKLKAVVELENSNKEVGGLDNEIKKAMDANKKSDINFEKQKGLKKEKFDIEFNKIVKAEKNDDIKDYIKIKKIELAEQLLEFEMNFINNEMGISEDEIQGSEMLKKLISGKKEEMEKYKNMAKEIEDSFGKSSNKEDDSDKFDIEEARGNEDYAYDKYLKHEFKTDEEITFWSVKNAKDADDYKGTPAFISEETATEEDMINIYKEKGKNIKIKRSKIMSRKADEEEKPKEDESKDDSEE